jgi:hypothetical protein
VRQDSRSSSLAVEEDLSWDSTPNGNAATPRGSRPGVPRGIANDPMTAEVAMAGGIDGIADAAG